MPESRDLNRLLLSAAFAGPGDTSLFVAGCGDIGPLSPAVGQGVDGFRLLCLADAAGSLPCSLFPVLWLFCNRPLAPVMGELRDHDLVPFCGAVHAVHGHRAFRITGRLPVDRVGGLPPVLLSRVLRPGGSPRDGREKTQKQKENCRQQERRYPPSLFVSLSFSFLSHEHLPGLPLSAAVLCCCLIICLF